MPFLSTALLLALVHHPAAAQGTPMPPLPAVEPRYHYSGPAGQGEYTAAQIADLVEQARTAQHLVWLPGWDGWKAWSDVAPIAAAVEPLAPPPVPAPAVAPAPFNYHGPDGRTEQLDAAAVAARVRTQAGSHLVWRQGMANWTQAADVPEIAAQIALQPPPLPVAGPPPVPPAPVAAPVAPEAAPEAPPAQGQHGASCGGCEEKVKFGGEVWFNAEAQDLQAAGSDAEGSFHPTFLVKRARIRADVKLSDSISGKLLVDFPQDSGSSEYVVDVQNVYDRLAALEGGVAGEGTSPSIDVRDYPDGWSTVLKDAYLDWSFGKAGHRVRAGMQKSVFGSLDWFEGYDAFFFGGSDAFKTLAWRTGHVDTRDLGVAYRLAPSDLWALDAQLLNGTGDGDLDDNAGKDMVARLSVDTPVGLGVQASGLRGARGATGEDSLTQFDASVRFDRAWFRAMAELMVGKAVVEGEAGPFMGYQAAAVAALPVKRGPVTRLDLEARFLFYDPYMEQGQDSYPDAWWLGNGALFVHWKVGCKQRLLTGLVYEGYVSENADLPLEHGLVGQLVWNF